MKVLVTGSSGFLGGYLIEELLEAGHEVVGVDNLSRYGDIVKSFDTNARYRFVRGDCKDVELLKELAADCDQMVAIAAMIGGISYFHEFAYDLLAENERIMAAELDAAIWAFREKHLSRIIVMSSSMVFENTAKYPSAEGDQLAIPPPSSTYGFQKLACEYYAKGGWEQYKLPYTIIRPFNCVGIGEKRAIRDTDIVSGNIKLALSHVVPDLVQKILKGQDPLEILGSGQQIRHYTYGGDLAHGIRLAIESDDAVNEDFNLSTAQSTTVLELAELIWKKIHGTPVVSGAQFPKHQTPVVSGAQFPKHPGDGKPFRWVSAKPFPYDVQKRVPDIGKARRVLGFEAATTLDQMLDEVIPWIREQIDLGTF